jgi:GNAT superfamily N-acetyltransferase
MDSRNYIMKKVNLKTLHGKEMSPYIDDLANLRMQVFRDYPYLYEGTREYEEKYLQVYLDCPDSTMVIVLDGDKIVGASTAIPMKDESDIIKAPFLEGGYDTNQICYFGESVLLKAYRGQNIGKHFFQEREAAARQLNLSIAAFCGVVRAPNDPRRPSDWFPLDNFWKKMGFVCHPELKLFYEWKEIGETAETPKPMVFWLKQLKDKT